MVMKWSGASQILRKEISNVIRERFREKRTLSKNEKPVSKILTKHPFCTFD